MGRRVAMTAGGISCEMGGAEVMLDPRAPGPGVNFVSHAHSDHLPSGAPAGAVLCSEATGAIAAARGREVRGRVSRVDGLELVDAGHIHGSAGLLGGGVFYTGDICTRDRAGLSGARVPRCEVLITECTFGLPEFSFPPVREVVSEASDLIASMYARGVPVILMGYALGKAQALCSLFRHWGPLYCHDDVLAMNEAHRALGVDLPEAVGHTEAEARGLLARGPWTMVAPVMSERSPLLRRLRSRYGAVTVGFSGWARSARFGFCRRGDYSFPLSDHCDHAELVEVARRTGAGTVYTTHGFEAEFAAHLSSALGVDARPLGGGRVGGGTRGTRT